MSVIQEIKKRLNKLELMVEQEKGMKWANLIDRIETIEKVLDIQPNFSQDEDDEDEDDEDDGSDDEENRILASESGEDDDSTKAGPWIIHSGNRPENKGLSAYWTGRDWEMSPKRAKTFVSLSAAKAYMKRDKNFKPRNPKGYFPPEIVTTNRV